MAFLSSPLGVVVVGAAVNLLFGVLKAEENKSAFIRSLDAMIASVFPDPVGFLTALITSPKKPESK